MPMNRVAAAATGIVAMTLALASVAWACGPLGVTPRYSFTYEITQGAYTSNLATYDPLTTGKITGFKVKVQGVLNLPFNEGGARGRPELWLGNVAANAADLPEGLWSKCNPTVGNKVGDLLTKVYPNNKYTTETIPVDGEPITAAELAGRTAGTTYMMCSLDRMETWKALITIA